MDNAIEIGQRIPPFVHGAKENPVDFLVAKEGITINVIPLRVRKKQTRYSKMKRTNTVSVITPFSIPRGDITIQLVDFLSQYV